VIVQNCFTPVPPQSADKKLAHAAVAASQNNRGNWRERVFDDDGKQE